MTQIILHENQLKCAFFAIYATRCVPLGFDGGRYHYKRELMRKSNTTDNGILSLVVVCQTAHQPYNNVRNQGEM